MAKQDLGLPPRPFLFTLDQIAALMYVELEHFRKRYCYYEGRDIGPQYHDLIWCRNIAPRGAPPDWRVSEREVQRFLKQNGFRVHERGWIE